MFKSLLKFTAFFLLFSCSEKTEQFSILKGKGQDPDDHHEAIRFISNKIFYCKDTDALNGYMYPCWSGNLNDSVFMFARNLILNNLSKNDDYLRVQDGILYQVEYINGADTLSMYFNPDHESKEDVILNRLLEFKKYAKEETDSIYFDSEVIKFYY